MTLDFTAIDFETANSHRASVCSVGLVKVRDGQVVGQSGGLVRPDIGHDHFDGFNTAIHGITAAMVAKAPPWRRVARWIAHYVGTDLLVAHNAAFDIGVLRDACTAGSIPWPRLDFLCTMLLARQALRLPSYRLPFVAAECGVELGRHHEALSDARACAQVAVALAQKQGAGTLRELADALDIRAGHLEEGQYVPGARLDAKTGRDGRPALLAPGRNPEADSGHPLFGRVIVFTGTLRTQTRQDAWDEVAKVGGVPELSVTKHTNILVVGDVNPAVLAPGAATTGKAARAFALQAGGQDIEVMTEDDFLRGLRPLSRPFISRLPRRHSLACGSCLRWKPRPRARWTTRCPDIDNWQAGTAAAGGYVAPNTSFANFMTTANAASARPIITVNYGTPSLAAAWAQAAASDSVGYWEVGNEVYGNGTYGANWEADAHCDTALNGPAVTCSPGCGPSSCSSWTSRSRC